MSSTRVYCMTLISTATMIYCLQVSHLFSIVCILLTSINHCLSNYYHFVLPPPYAILSLHGNTNRMDDHDYKSVYFLFDVEYFLQFTIQVINYLFIWIYRLAWFEPVNSFYYFPLKTKSVYHTNIECSLIQAIVKIISPHWSWDYENSTICRGK